MKWITLKMSSLPVIALEVDRAVQVFAIILTKYQQTQKAQDLTELNLLRKDFIERMQDLDKFYSDHYLNQNIEIFHMLKLRLKKAVFELDRITKSIAKVAEKNNMGGESRKIEESMQSGNINKSSSLAPLQDTLILEQPLFTYYDHNSAPQDSPLFGEKSSKKVTETLQKQLPRPPSNTNIKPKAHPSAKGQLKKPSKPAPAKSYAFKPKKQISVVSKQEEGSSEMGVSKGGASKGSASSSSGIRNRLGVSNVSSYVGDESLSDMLMGHNELKFTIKMTKQEYKQLLDMKKKMVEQQQT